MTGYDTNERNTIFEALSPASNFTSEIAYYGGPNYLNSAIAHVNSFGVCSPPVTEANMFVASNINLANARARGMEVNQRFRVNPNLVFDGYWDAQSVTIFDAPNSLLMDNPTLIPGSQLPGIPLHQWGMYMNVTTTTGGELYLNYHQVDSNNEMHRVSFGSADLAFTQKLGKGSFVNLGVTNVFNQAVDTYGRIGYGVFVPENQFGTDTNALQQGSERFGLAPASLSVSFIQKL